MLLFLLFVGINLQNKFGNKWRFRWNSYFNFIGTVILQLWLLPLVPFRHFVISLSRHFAISYFKHAFTKHLISGPKENSYLFDASWHKFGGARLDHVRVESSSYCFPRD